MNKKYFLSAFLSVGLLTQSLHAQNIGEILNDVINQVVGGNNNTNTNSNKGNGISINSLSNTDIVSALRQALNIGAQNASKKLNIANGFFGNQIIKILMPPEAVKVENTLRQIGMGSIVDKAILQMNRAAEDAVGKAVPIFTNAITHLSLQDGLNILKGGQGAATNFLRQTTSNALTQAFQPVINNSLGKVGATALWSKVFNVYNKLPTTMNKINPNLSGYVTQRALNGLFVNIADEENKIRTSPAARITDLLQKVFGAS